MQARTPPWPVLPVLGLVAVLAAGDANATLVEAFDIEDLAVFASEIVEGRVLDVRSAWEGRLIFTDVEVAVERCYKGPCAREVVVVRTAGGVVDDLEMVVHGAARYQPGERVLLFLEDIDGGRTRTVGLVQGKLRIEPGLAGTRVVRSLGDLALVGRRAGAVTESRELPLDVVIRRVEAALTAPRIAPAP